MVCSFSVLSFASPKNVTGTLPSGKCSGKTSFRRLRMQMALRKTHQPHPDMRCSISTRGSSWKLAENLFEKTELWCQTFPGMFNCTLWFYPLFCHVGALVRIQPWVYQLYSGGECNHGFISCILGGEENTTMVLSAVFGGDTTMVLSPPPDPGRK